MKTHRLIVLGTWFVLAPVVYVALSRAFAGAAEQLVLGSVWGVTEDGLKIAATHYGHAVGAIAVLCGVLGYGLRSLEPSP
jgi:hypothetical protein